MARVREFPLECPACSGGIRLITFVTHLGEPLEPPDITPARGPPNDWGELVQAHYGLNIFQASPKELPAIELRSAGNGGVSETAL